MRGKAFAWERPFPRRTSSASVTSRRPSGPILALCTADLADKEAVLATGTKGFFTIPHFNGYAAVLVQLKAVAKRPLREAIEDAWLACAPGALARDSPPATPGARSGRPPSRGTPQESLKRSRIQRSSPGTHSHSVMEAWTMRTQPRR